VHPQLVAKYLLSCSTLRARDTSRRWTHGFVSNHGWLFGCNDWPDLTLFSTAVCGPWKKNLKNLFIFLCGHTKFEEQTIFLVAFVKETKKCQVNNPF
jgi:hypothetical protein